MSLGSFLSKIWDHLKQLFGALPKELKNAINIGVTVVEAIKVAIDSPVVDVLTAIIPGDIDDRIKEWLRAQIPNILVEMRLASDCSGLTDPNEITACGLKVLSGLGVDAKSAFYHNLSILIAQIAADGKLTWSDGVYLLEWYYQHKDEPEVSVQIGA